MQIDDELVIAHADSWLYSVYLPLINEIATERHISVLRDMFCIGFCIGFCNGVDNAGQNVISKLFYMNTTHIAFCVGYIAGIQENIKLEKKKLKH